MKTIFRSVFLCVSLFTPAFLGAQAVSINTDASAPAPSAILDVKSTNKGMLVPRMSTAQRTAIAAPAAGLLVYDTDIQSFWFYNGTAWTNLSGGGVPASYIADADGNTKVQTEAIVNEDMIRFSLGGMESMVLRKNAGGTPRLELPDTWSNTFVGVDAGSANTTGFSNTAFGTNTLFKNTTRSNLVAMGDSALYNNGVGASQAIHSTANTALGSKALYTNTTGFSNTATGFQALYARWRKIIWVTCKPPTARTTR